MNQTVDYYTYRVTWSDEDQEFVGLCAEFPSLSWMAKKPETALNGIRKIVDETLNDMQQTGEKIPEAFATKKYSGKFMVRIPPEIHRELSIKAAESGVSLNRFVSAKLTH